MKHIDPLIAILLVVAIPLTACVAPPLGPSIPVMPGANKNFDAFAADQAACQQYASAQIAPSVAAANNQAVGGALLSSALGAGLGAGIGAVAGNAGRGAAIGAASGGALGIFANAGGAPYAQMSLQQQYDVMYGECMTARGNSVPGFSPPPGAPPYRAGPTAPPPPGPGQYPSSYPGPGPYPSPYPGAPVPPPPGY
jgi:hypothetical protein